MRKLLLEIQMMVEGYVCGPYGALDRITFHWDEALKKHVMEIGHRADTVLMERKMNEGFITDCRVPGGWILGALRLLTAVR